MNYKKSLICAFMFLLGAVSSFAKIDTKPSLAAHVTDMISWKFAKEKPQTWTDVTLPHSCNAMDGHSAAYYRGKAYYRKMLKLTKDQVSSPLFILFEGAGQTATVSVNGKQVYEHKGGYTPFIVDLKGIVNEGKNEIMVMCDNTEKIDVVPISSDFNKNNGLHNPVHLLGMNPVYASPSEYGMYRMHVSTPSVSDKKGETVVETAVINSTSQSQKVNVKLTLEDASGKVCYSKVSKLTIAANESQKYMNKFTLSNPHLWQGVEDPYLYQMKIEITDAKGAKMDDIHTTVGYRYYKMDADKGFFLNGHSYPLRGVSMHQDYDKCASALSYAQIDQNYDFVKEIGTNFLRLAHYPHNDYEYQLCDKLGVIVQTEIPWVNICGAKAPKEYFENIHSQMHEMVTNLYNHPSIVFWGMWNEVNNWGTKDEFQGKFDPEKVVEESMNLYRYTKQMDPYRYVGVTDCSNYAIKQYAKLGVDYYSENRYEGWYFSQAPNFSADITKAHEKMGVVNVSEYGAGTNPFCHSLEPEKTTKRGRGGRHDEEYGNYLHESYLAQLNKLPFINFSSLWVFFDFAVASRLEGYMDSDDGVHFYENDYRKFINDKGIVTRDRKTKKDAFYLYKASWNKKTPTVYITSRRFTKRPASAPVNIKVYSNAKSLTLYQNNQKIQTLETSGESTGVIWKFNPVNFKSDKDTFTVVSDKGVKDEVTFERFTETDDD